MGFRSKWSSLLALRARLAERQVSLEKALLAALAVDVLAVAALLALLGVQHIHLPARSAVVHHAGPRAAATRAPKHTAAAAHPPASLPSTGAPAGAVPPRPSS